jgi:spermidine/putrescine transport system ATP-binding protein
MKNSSVRFVNISKHFGSTVALDNLDLNVEPGEFCTLLGPSGCGKSTTLRILGGFESPTKGQVFLDDENVTNTPPNQRNVNMVFQDYALFPHMTAGNNIAFGLELKGKSKTETTERVEELLKFLELEGFKDRKPDELSGGQRQRVALARSLAPDPKVLLLDEPLGALDAKLRKQVQIELKDIQKQTGKTFVFVTHDQEEALTISDRIVVIKEGRLEQSGTPKELYSQPESCFVAEFIGETNMLSCDITGAENQQVFFEWHGHNLCGKCWSGKPEIGQKAIVAIRPENIDCSATKPRGEKSVEARVIQRIFKGSYTTFKLAVGNEHIVELKVSMDGRHADSIVDDKLWFTLESSFLSVLLR